MFSDRNVLLRLNQIEDHLVGCFEYIDKQIRILNFRITRPEIFSIACISQREESIMGKTVRVFTHQIDLAAVPAGNDAVSQTINCTGVFLDLENTSAPYSQSFSREAATLYLDAVEGEEVAIELSYADSLGNKTANPVRASFVVIDGIGPDVPADALTIKQVSQREVELPDEPIE